MSSTESFRFLSGGQRGIRKSSKIKTKHRQSSGEPVNTGESGRNPVTQKRGQQSAKRRRSVKKHSAENI